MKLHLKLKKEYKQNLINLLQKYEHDMFGIEIFLEDDGNTYFVEVESENSMLMHEVIDVYTESKEIKTYDGKNCKVCGNPLNEMDFIYDKLCSPRCRKIYNEEYKDDAK